MNLPWDAPSIGWHEWKAREINRVFHEQGFLADMSRITAATVRHGERSALYNQAHEGIPALLAGPLVEGTVTQA